MNKEELKLSEEFTRRNIKWIAQPHKIKVMDSFKTRYENWLPMTYKPDFLIQLPNKQKMYIEFKGYNRKGLTYKYRIIDKYFHDNNIDWFMVKYCQKRKDYYLYRQELKSMKNKNYHQSKIKTFWDHIL